MNSLNVPTNANAAVIEAAYEAWQQNPDSVDPTWRAFFQGFTLGSSGTAPTAVATSAAAGAPIIDSLKQSHVHYLINTYRAIGHMEAHLDPLSDPPPPYPKLSLAQFDLGEADLDTSFDVGTFLGGGQMKLADVLIALRTTYCDHIGVEYTHIQDVDVRRWLQDRMELTRNQPNFTRAEKIRILRRVHKAELFEKFLHTKYVGQKRFSLEGGETMIAALDSIIEHAPLVSVEEVVMGMAHRGRLNVLTSVMRKNFDLLFEQFSENYIPDAVGGDGDVKYHLGYEAILDTAAGKKVEVRLAANPSHLEIVDPVVEGKARARQRIRGDTERKRVLPLLIHGDAAFAGQGVVAETMNFSQLPGYKTGGTLHFIVNNQIGFTTDPGDARSTRYCTDVAKMIEAPVFHVNGVDELLFDLQDDARFEAAAHDVKFECLGNRAFTIRGDAALLHSAIENVLRNAIKQTVAGSTVILEVNPDATIGMLRLLVQDRGPGVPDEELEAIFGAFFRGSGAGGKADGHGLGLAIAQRVVAAHGGNIGARNRQGGGLCVEILLPFDVDNVR